MRIFADNDRWKRAAYGMVRYGRPVVERQDDWILQEI